MRKRIIVGLVAAFLIGGVLTASAQSVFASYNKAGQLNLYASAGYGGYSTFGAAVSPELIMGAFTLGPIPLEWGLMATGVVNFLPGFGIGAGAMATLHMGVIWNLDFFIGAGLGATILPGFGIGLTQTAGVSYKLSSNLTVLAQDTYIGSFGASDLGVYGIGLRLNL
jgi:hypothetical protein